MALLEPPASEGDFWPDTLANTKTLLHALDKAIYALAKDEVKSYQMDTGQTSVNVTRQDLPFLIDRREKLIKQIEDMEWKLAGGHKPRYSQGVPLW